MSVMKVSSREGEILETLRQIKAESGSHSPSLFALHDRIPDLDIKVDACFLSNPYATDLFIERLTAEGGPQARPRRRGYSCIG